MDDVHKAKAVAACDAILRIAPYIQCQGVTLSVPMPGHPPDTVAESANFIAIVDSLSGLVQGHDVTFILTDSRESRWLPTLLGQIHGKCVVNAALGFDNYVVMRHGNQDMEAIKCGKEDTSSESKETSFQQRLGCYFCSDVIAPTDVRNSGELTREKERFWDVPSSNVMFLLSLRISFQHSGIRSLEFT